MRAVVNLFGPRSKPTKGPGLGGWERVPGGQAETSPGAEVGGRSHLLCYGRRYDGCECSKSMLLEMFLASNVT